MHTINKRSSGLNVFTVSSSSLNKVENRKKKFPWNIFLLIFVVSFLTFDPERLRLLRCCLLNRLTTHVNVNGDTRFIARCFDALIRQFVWQIWAIYESFSLPVFSRRYTTFPFRLNNRATWKLRRAKCIWRSFRLYQLGNVSWCVLTSTSFRRERKCQNKRSSLFPLESVSLMSIYAIIDGFSQLKI